MTHEACSNIAAAIISAVGQNKSLTRLGLEDNGLSDRCSLELATALKSNSTLTGVNQSQNQLSDIGVRALVDVIATHPSCRWSNMVFANNHRVDESLLQILRKEEARRLQPEGDDKIEVKSHDSFFEVICEAMASLSVLQFNAIYLRILFCRFSVLLCLHFS